MGIKITAKLLHKIENKQVILVAKQTKATLMIIEING